jgi:hypothetical protein
MGVDICSGRGFVKWERGKEPDYDAVQFLVFCWLPLLPLRPLHRCMREGTTLSHPLRWSLGLLGAAYLRRWLHVVWVMGIFVMIAGLIGDLPRSTALAVGAGMIAGGCFLLWWLPRLDRRARAIRSVLGCRDDGSSDPACWTENKLADVSSPEELYGTSSFAGAVLPALSSGNYCEAMWAARLATALEEPGQGESLTDDILAQPEVREAIAHVERNPGSWSKVM